jgi:hypothetical protein
MLKAAKNSVRLSFYFASNSKYQFAKVAGAYYFVAKWCHRKITKKATNLNILYFNYSDQHGEKYKNYFSIAF